MRITRLIPPAVALGLLWVAFMVAAAGLASQFVH